MYEGMFLVDPAVAAMWDDLSKELSGIIARQGGEVIGLTRWDERKLAFPVAKQKRGTYVLSFFTLSDGGGVVEIERDCRLSENILRTLVVRADQFSVADMRLQLGEDIDEDVAQRLYEARGEAEIEARKAAQEAAAQADADARKERREARQAAARAAVEAQRAAAKEPEGEADTEGAAEAEAAPPEPAAAEEPDESQA